jgi:hypothetical protein
MRQGTTRNNKGSSAGALLKGMMKTSARKPNQNAGKIHL